MPLNDFTVQTSRVVTETTGGGIDEISCDYGMGHTEMAAFPKGL